MNADDAALVNILLAARVIHEYHRVDVGEVWRTIQQDIPTLVRDIEALAPKPGG